MSDQQTLAMLERRRIEAGILKHVYDTLKASHGVEVAKRTIAELVRRSAMEQARQMAAAGRRQDLACRPSSTARSCGRAAARSRLEVKEQSDTRYRFNVTRCKYAEMYRDMGLGEIGHLLSCQRDGTFCEGYDKRLKLKRTQTIMQGASHCDFDYTLRRRTPRRDDPGLCPRRLSLHPRRVPVFGRRRGRARLPHRARHLPQARAAGARASSASKHIIKARGRPLTAFCACELRSPAPFTDAGFRGFNETLRRDAAPSGASTTPHQDQSGRAQQRLPRDRPAGRALASTPSPSRSPSQRQDADLRGGRQRRGQGGRGQLPRAHRALRRDRAPRRCGKKPFSCWARWSGG